MKPVSPPQDFHHGLLGRQGYECFLKLTPKKRRRRRDGPLMPDHPYYEHRTGGVWVKSILLCFIRNDRPNS